ncbi:hypothetical protein SSBR45G_03890 [Bradyrhizobium sp. SSBR45G]|uniref:hypothetical protein n=1 Tax=unclassified Bradyrhizobium TaxID=2631580 RepID=UPI002342908A|nr:MULTISPECIES: hypothetical protein [unclassified Bradyrhizobium]GLH75481.1 hypothetical protein SSBR45G_03890 [Bradyrhizobium sp. SSBR45G]GLH82732.1 hypothetical protein SSBR45R_01920 [Bradyrhizobium sp. SSBR45R]
MRRWIEARLGLGEASAANWLDADAKRFIEALQSELKAAKDDAQRYKRITEEMGVIMGRLRDERDSHKLEWESASAELRRLTRPRATTASANGAALRSGRDAPVLKNTPSSALRVLCVGTGRDGTTSLTRMMQEIFDHQGNGDRAVHEWGSRELNELFCRLKETKDSSIEEEIRQMIRDCPHACVVGNGYAAVLPIIAELLGDQITLVHLRRRDRAACIASLAENAELSPQNHVYYADSPAAERKRPTAFHFGEMTQPQWFELSLTDKFGWYYDKTHSLIERYANLFPNTLAVDTEDLAADSVRAALAHAAGSTEAPRAFHVNRFVDLRHVPADRRSFVQRLLGQLDVQMLAHDDLYGLRQVLNEMIYHLAHFPDAAPGALDELRWTLVEMHRLLDNRIGDVRELMERVGVVPDVAGVLNGQGAPRASKEAYLNS